MAVIPVPDFSFPQNQGFNDTDVPIIHSIRWRHLPTSRVFTDVHDVITYHQQNVLEIDIKTHIVSYLDIYFRKDANLTDVKVYLRYVRAFDNILIEELLRYGQAGALLSLQNDTDPNLQVIKGIAFTQNDLGDGTPMYDFLNMAKEGIYEVWVKATNATGTLHLRIPFQFANLVKEIPSSSEGSDSSGSSGSSSNGRYDEYYVTIVEGVSPFTKRPMTPFRPAGIAMLKVPYQYTGILTRPVQNPSSNPTDGTSGGSQPPSGDGDSGGSSGGTSGGTSGGSTGGSSGNPTSDPVVGSKPSAPCALQVTPLSVSAQVGATLEFTLKHSNKSGVFSIEYQYDKEKLQDLGENKFKVLKEGSATITFVVTYNDGQECKVTASAELTPVPTNSNPIVVECGNVVNAGQGSGEYIHPVSEEGIVYIEYDFYSALDRMRVYVGGVLKHDTGTVRYKEGSPFGFHYKPSDGEIRVVMNDGKEGNSGTKWTYTLYCPSNVPVIVKTTAIIVG